MMAEGQHGARSRSWELTTDPQVGGRQREKLGLSWAFEMSKATHGNKLPPTRPYFLILPKIVPQIKAQAFNIHESIGSILI